MFRAKITAPSRRLAGQLTIATFHRVLQPGQLRDYSLPGLCVTPEELDSHLKFLTQHFECMSLVSALERWGSERQGRPLLAVTFDDGQLDNFENALPVLEENGVTATFYVPSQVLGDSTALWHDGIARVIRALRPSSESAIVEFLAAHDLRQVAPIAGQTPEEWSVSRTKSWSPELRVRFLQEAERLGQEHRLADGERPSWDAFMSVQQLRDLVKRGHEVGAHSHSHALLPQLDEDEMRREIIDSKRLLEEALGTPVETFCYPNGDHDARVRELTRMAGYRAAVSTAWGSNREGADLFRLRRCDMTAQHAKSCRGQFSPARLAWRMSGMHPGLRETEGARA